MSSGSRQAGFTYLCALLLVAATGAGLAAISEIWSHSRQREKEAELIWVGNQFKRAIGLYYHRSPGAVKRYPEKLEELLEDRRHLSVQRYLRKIYLDPITGSSDWGLVYAPAGGIMGVYSISKRQPFRVSSGSTYSKWQFIYEEPLPLADGG